MSISDRHVTCNSERWPERRWPEQRWPADWRGCGNLIFGDSVSSSAAALLDAVLNRTSGKQAEDDIFVARKWAYQI
jgi:hypothetical protein